MAMSEEQQAALAGAVAGLIDILMANMAAGEDADWQRGLDDYAGQVQRIQTMADSQDLPVLVESCARVSDNLARLRHRDTPPGEEEQLLLEEWPAVVMGYLDDPDGNAPALIELLQQPGWPLPLDPADADELRSPGDAAGAPATGDASAHHPGEAADSQHPAPASDADTGFELDFEDEGLSTLDVLEGVVADTMDVVGELQAADSPAALSRALRHYLTGVSTLARLAGEAGLDGLRGASEWLRDNLEILLEHPPDHAIRDLLEDWPARVFEYLELRGQQDAGAGLLRYLGDFRWPRPLADTPAAALAAHLGGESAAIEAPGPWPEAPAESTLQSPPGTEDQHRLEQPDEDHPDHGVEARHRDQAALGDALSEATDSDRIGDQEPAGTAPLTAELLSILASELPELAGATERVLTAASGEALQELAEDVERYTEACASVGLDGLTLALGQLAGNLRELDPPAAPPLQALLAGWTGAVAGYLSEPTRRETAAPVVDLLLDPAWPVPLPGEMRDDLLDSLGAVTVISAQEALPARAQEATDADVSLSLPVDAHPELLDSLLQELPGQTAEFSRVVQAMADGSATPGDVALAQRIAHTLKGAGNTVGVRGIANLTHHTEDILVALSAVGQLPPPALAETLVETADCLESMSEALIGQGEAPAQARAVLQTVLDWANRIDREGLPTETTPAPAPRPTDNAPAAAQPAAPEVSGEAAEHAAGEPVPVLRVPAPLVDELLRLVGETLIMTGQVQEGVRRTADHARLLRDQHHGLQQLVAELEQQVDIRGLHAPLLAGGDARFDPLELEQYGELHTLSRRLQEAGNDARSLERLISGNLRILGELLEDQGQLHRETQEAVLRTRMVPVSTVVPRLARSVRQTCRLLDKRARLEVRGEHTLIDSNVLNALLDPLMHVLRNAVDHGVETPEQRESLGKDPEGLIGLALSREGNNILVSCRDDGRGLDLATIRRKAEERGLLSPGQPANDEELTRLIMAPGFSTRDHTTQTSGRGIGMDVVNSQLRALKGSLEIRSVAGRGTTMELRLPVSLLSTHALLVQVHERRYAIAERGVRQILHASDGHFERLGDRPVYRVDNAIHDLLSLETVLGLPEAPRETRETRPLLLIQDETGALHAVSVPEVLASRDLVVKGLGAYMPRLPGIIGATILGDGSVTVVLDMPVLLRTARSSTPPAAILPGSVRRPRALVVDDSLSARQSLAQFLEDIGFEVSMARDGLDAIAVLETLDPDILLVDLEMPRMNGLELTSHLRSPANRHDFPIIMLTSRSTAKHRAEADAAGVDVYLVKPFDEDTLLGHIRELLPGDV